LERDLNRGAWDPRGQVEHWVDENPEGILLDVHSFPAEHSWQNPTVVWKTGDPEEAQTPLVVLLPVKNQEFALSFQKDIGHEKVQTYQGSTKNKLVNLGVSRSVLLEFHESKEDEWPIDEIGTLVRRFVVSG